MRSSAAAAIRAAWSASSCSPEPHDRRPPTPVAQLLERRIALPAACIAVVPGLLGVRGDRGLRFLRRFTPAAPLTVVLLTGEACQAGTLQLDQAFGDLCHLHGS
ncbi:hypothetical protein ACIRU3_39215 [Streptomyces sp. NPDC101151]|uniref:hypothetical protein n=1 Tax=Streptomyces sp. NPDC101151 TaxID=3366115 RepID=UPI0038255810